MGGLAHYDQILQEPDASVGAINPKIGRRKKNDDKTKYHTFLHLHRLSMALTRVQEKNLYLDHGQRGLPYDRGNQYC